MRKAFARIRCYFTGHDWEVIRQSYHRWLLAHLSDTAGLDGNCRRCGKQVRRFPQAMLDAGLLVAPQDEEATRDD